MLMNWRSSTLRFEGMPHGRFIVATITFRQSDGQAVRCEIEPGLSIMELAVKHDIEGILAECGGAAACATCHVFLGEGWEGRLSEMGDQERDMLAFAVDVRSESRLGCQITLRDSFDGLTVEVPEAQF